MRELFQNPYLVGTVIVLAIIFILGIIYRYRPKKVLCKHEGCTKKMFGENENKTPLCEEHYYEYLLEKAKKENPPEKCSKCGELMTIKLIKDADNRAYHECRPCKRVTMDMDLLADLIPLKMDSYPKDK